MLSMIRVTIILPYKTYFDSVCTIMVIMYRKNRPAIAYAIDYIHHIQPSVQPRMIYHVYNNLSRYN